MSLFPNPKFQTYDSNGDPLSGGKLYTYEAGTVTAKRTFSDKGLSTPNTNPIILDSRGEAIVYGSGDYKFILKNSADSLIWTFDNLRGVAQTVWEQNAFYPDASESDQGAATVAGDKTVKDFVDAIGTTKKATIIFVRGNTGNTTTYTFLTSETTPSNITVKRESGVLLSIANTKTLTIAGLFESGLDQAFSGAGRVVFGAGAIDRIYPQWRGVTGDGSTNDTTAFQAIIDDWEASNLVGEMYVPNGTYLLDALTFTAPSNRLALKFGGAGKSTIFKLNSAIALFTINMGASNFQQLDLGQFSVNMNAQDGQAIVQTASSGQKAVLQDIFIYNFHASGSKPVIEQGTSSHSTDFINIVMIGSPGGTFDERGYGIELGGHHSRVIHCDFQRLDYPITFNGAVTNSNLVIEKSRFEDCTWGIYADTRHSETLVIEQNKFEAILETAIHLYGTDTGNNRHRAVTISRNYFTEIPTTKFGLDLKRIIGLDVIGNRFDGVAGAISARLVSTISNMKLRSNVIAVAGMDGAMTNGLTWFPVNDITKNMSCFPDTKYIVHDHSDVSTIGLGEDTLNYHSFPATSLTADAGIRIRAAGTVTDVGGGNKTIKLHFGASSWTVLPTANDNDDWFVEAVIHNTAVNAQRIIWKAWRGSTSGAAADVYTGYETAAENCAAGKQLNISGTCSDATDTITQTMWEWEVF